MKILILGGGRWANVYVENICKFAKNYFNPQITIVSKSSSNFLRETYSNKKNIVILDNLSLLKSKDFDLGIIASRTSRHFLDAIEVISFVRRLIIEKPCFESYYQYSLFNQILSQHHNVNTRINISCPFLFTYAVIDVLFGFKDKFIQEANLLWIDPVNNPKGYSYRDHISQTAISHFLPIALAVLDADLSKLRLNEFNNQSLSLNLISSRGIQKINLDFSLSSENSRVREIELVDSQGVKYSLDLNHTSNIQKGYSWNRPEDYISPLFSQLIYTCFDLKHLDRWVSYKCASKVSDLLRNDINVINN